MTDRIPAIVNVKSGTADAAQKVLGEGESFEVHAVEPEDIARTIRDVVTAGAKRILVSGGDGTIATAAAELLESRAELAILPGGTLNHFARDLGVSTEPAEALQLAVNGQCRGVDVGVVNGHVFLNTSSVGAYVRFVRIRSVSSDGSAIVSRPRSPRSASCSSSAASPSSSRWRASSGSIGRRSSSSASASVSCSFPRSGVVSRADDPVST